MKIALSSKQTLKLLRRNVVRLTSSPIALNSQLCDTEAASVNTTVPCGIITVIGSQTQKYPGDIMKIVYSIITTLILTVTFAIAAAAQTPRPTPTPATQPRPTPAPVTANTPVPQSKIALIDTTAFGDEKNGIYRYVDAARAVQSEFKTRTDEIQNLQNRLNSLVNEIDALMKVTPVDQKTVQAKQQQGQILQTEFNTKKAKLDEDVGKRYEQVVLPISNQIGAAMDQFAT